MSHNHNYRGFIAIQSFIAELAFLAAKQDICALLAAQLYWLTNSPLDEQVEQQFKAHSKYLTEPRMLEAAKENIRGNVMWMLKNAKAVCQWLDKQA